MPHIITDEKKLSFDDISEKDDNLLHNSNMQNLVSACKKIDGEVEIMETEIKRLRALQVEIKAFARSPKNLQNTTEVSRLYDETMPREMRNKRW